MAKTPHFKEDAAHRPEVRFYPIHSSVSGGEKRRKWGSGDNPAKSAILDGTFDQNLWSRRAKHKIVMQKNKVKHIDFRSSLRETKRSSKSFGRTQSKNDQIAWKKSPNFDDFGQSGTETHTEKLRFGWDYVPVRVTTNFSKQYSHRLFGWKFANRGSLTYLKFWRRKWTQWDISRITHW